jgi:hypothetical protein
VAFVKFANPPEKWFKQKAAYYFATNKFSFFVADNISYFRSLHAFDAAKLSKEELAAEIDFYQQHQPFQFTSKEYPLLHADSSQDVLGSFFNLGPTPPNIVILVVEGLSRDFSGDKAYAGSFTPFLDSLSGTVLPGIIFSALRPALSPRTRLFPVRCLMVNAGSH